MPFNWLAVNSLTSFRPVSFLLSVIVPANSIYPDLRDVLGTGEIEQNTTQNSHNYLSWSNQVGVRCPLDLYRIGMNRCRCKIQFTAYIYSSAVKTCSHIMSTKEYCLWQLSIVFCSFRLYLHRMLFSACRPIFHFKTIKGMVFLETLV